MSMERDARIYIAGQQTLIGAALVRTLAREGFTSIILEEPDQPDLTRAEATEAWLTRTAPEYLVVAGGRSGGILANVRYPATLMRENLLVASHLIEGAFRHGVKKLLYLGSSCVYPRVSPQPIPVEALLTGPVVGGG